MPPPAARIPADERYPKRHVTVRGLRMAYVDAGQGDPIVFLHGNPSSSYEWRNVIPHVTGLGRCLAPDLVGMGDSEKLAGSGPGSYRFVEHREYLDEFLELLDVRERVTLVLHDWGSALGFDWAYRHASAIRGIAHLESFAATIDSWDDWPKSATALFQAIRSDAGEHLVLDDDIVVERFVPAGVLRELTEAEMAVYRRPYLQPGESRRPTLTWPREIPIAGEPGDVHETITRYAAWLATTVDIPKLFLEAVPGAMFPSHRAVARSWPAQTVRRIPGGHLATEDAPDAIGTAIADWMRDLR